MLPRKWPLPMRMIIRWSSVTIAFLAVFELGRVMEMNNNDGRSNPCRRLIGADSHQPDADEHLLDQWQPNDNQQVPPDDAAVKRNEDGERSKLKSLGESMIINGAAAGNSIRSVAVAAAVNDVNDRDIVDEPVNGVDRNQLPKDFWSGRRNDDIFIDTNRPIINPHPFRRTINSPSVCGGSESQGSGVFLLCYVHTAVDHFKRRERIRKTWANQAIPRECDRTDSVFHGQN
jgi:hypothetical protein